MSFDALHDPQSVPASTMRRQRRGRAAYLSGLAAEAAVEAHWRAGGAHVLSRRWRGGGAEIDLIVEDDAGLHFIEVKSSDTVDDAIWHMSQAQLDRIAMAAQGYLAENGRGLDQQMQIDLALVDRIGRVTMMENISQYAA